MRLPVCQPGDGGTPHHVNEPGNVRLDVQEGNPISYPEFTEAAMDHFAPRVSPCMAVFEFHKRKQETDETVDEYLTALRILVTDCGFGDQAERNLMLRWRGASARRHSRNFWR